MLEAQALIERVRRHSPSHQRLDLTVDRAHAEIQGGEIFLARAVESLDPFLREPWLPVAKQQLTVTVEVPTGKVYAPGQAVSLLGPVGRPLPIRDGARNLLLIAVDAMPAALLLTAMTALRKGDAVTMALIGTARHYPLEALPPEVEIQQAESLEQWSELVNALKWAHQVFALAVPPFDSDRYRLLLERANAAMIKVPEAYLYGLYQPPLPCGVGACDACLIRCGGRDVAVCTEGFALDLTVSVKPSGS